VSTTTTTQPDPCDSIAAGPTFASIECRLAELRDALNALGNTTSRATALRSQLARASGAERNAYAVCVGTDSKRAKKELKGSAQALGRVRTLLASKAAKKIGGRTELLATVDQVRTDTRALRSALDCPPEPRVGAPSRPVR
jgi:hypothetical protein